MLLRGLDICAPTGFSCIFESHQPSKHSAVQNDVVSTVILTFGTMSSSGLHFSLSSLREALSADTKLMLICTGTSAKQGIASEHHA